MPACIGVSRTPRFSRSHLHVGRQTIKMTKQYSYIPPVTSLLRQLSSRPTPASTPLMPPRMQQRCNSTVTLLHSAATFSNSYGTYRPPSPNSVAKTVLRRDPDNMVTPPQNADNAPSRSRTQSIYTGSLFQHSTCRQPGSQHESIATAAMTATSANDPAYFQQMPAKRAAQ